MPVPATATIVKVWQDATTVHAALRVTEAPAVIEYVVYTPRQDAQGQDKSAAVIKAELAAKVSALRAAQFDLPTINVNVTGTVNV